MQNLEVLTRITFSFLYCKWLLSYPFFYSMLFITDKEVSHPSLSYLKNKQTKNPKTCGGSVNNLNVEELRRISHLKKNINFFSLTISNTRVKIRSLSDCHLDLVGQCVVTVHTSLRFSRYCFLNVNVWEELHIKTFFQF